MHREGIRRISRNSEPVFRQKRPGQEAHQDAVVVGVELLHVLSEVGVRLHKELLLLFFLALFDLVCHQFVFSLPLCLLCRGQRGIVRVLLMIHLSLE